jgi:hypothetical protein
VKQINPRRKETKMKKVTSMIAATMLAVGLLTGCATSGGHDHSKCAACCKDGCAKCCKDAAACEKCCGKK